jgi:hypothetical protein
VQTERIIALNRLRATEKFIARIEPLIIAVQGELPMESSNEAATEPLPASAEAPIAPVS